MYVSLFPWQNQLLAKGLLFMEEKVKLCEGKCSRKPVLEGSCALMFGQMRLFACLESKQPCLVLSWGVSQPLGSPVRLKRGWDLGIPQSHDAPTSHNCTTKAATWLSCGRWTWAHGSSGLDMDPVVKLLGAAFCLSLLNVNCSLM